MALPPSTYFGTSGNDLWTGTSLNETAYGLAGDDALNGDAGDDSIEGNDGNDTLNGGSGIDTLVGGIGDDIYYRPDASDTLIEQSGEGTDLVRIDFASYTLSAANIENLTIYGGEGMALTGAGNSGNNVITGLPGDAFGGRFSLLGLDGDDTLVGSGNNDTLNGGNGADSLAGGAGNDTYNIDASDTISENAAGGTDSVFLIYDSYTLSANVENLTVTGGEGFMFTIVGNASDNVISAQIDVGVGNFVFNGGDGHDTLNGADFNDTLNGGIGRDVLNAGAGDDSLLGGGSNDVVNGGDGNDYIDGGNSSDKLYGNDGNDYLDGGDANDNLFGNAGRDTLHGGAGDDVLAGAGGRDVFLFDANLATNGVDTITDFLTGMDKVYIGVGVSGLGYTGYLNAANFVSGAAATTADEHFVYDVGNLYYDADGSGAGAQVQFATFSNAPELSASDIVIV